MDYYNEQPNVTIGDKFTTKQKDGSISEFGCESTEKYKRDFIVDNLIKHHKLIECAINNLNTYHTTYIAKEHYDFKLNGNFSQDSNKILLKRVTFDTSEDDISVKIIQQKDPGNYGIDPNMEIFLSTSSKLPDGDSVYKDLKNVNSVEWINNPVDITKKTILVTYKNMTCALYVVNQDYNDIVKINPKLGRLIVKLDESLIQPNMNDYSLGNINGFVFSHMCYINDRMTMFFKKTVTDVTGTYYIFDAIIPGLHPKYWYPNIATITNPKNDKLFGPNILELESRFGYKDKIVIPNYYESSQDSSLEDFIKSTMIEQSTFVLDAGIGKKLTTYKDVFKNRNEDRITEIAKMSERIYPKKSIDFNNNDTNYVKTVKVNSVIGEIQLMCAAYEHVDPVKYAGYGAKRGLFISGGDAKRNPSEIFNTPYSYNTRHRDIKQIMPENVYKTFTSTESKLFYDLRIYWEELKVPVSKGVYLADVKDIVDVYSDGDLVIILTKEIGKKYTGEAYIFGYNHDQLLIAEKTEDFDIKDYFENHYFAFDGDEGLAINSFNKHLLVPRPLPLNGYPVYLDLPEITKPDGTHPNINYLNEDVKLLTHQNGYIYKPFRINTIFSNHLDSEGNPTDVEMYGFKSGILGFDFNDDPKTYTFISTYSFPNTGKNMKFGGFETLVIPKSGHVAHIGETSINKVKFSYKNTAKMETGKIPENETSMYDYKKRERFIIKDDGTFAYALTQYPSSIAESVDASGQVKTTDFYIASKDLLHTEK